MLLMGIFNSKLGLLLILGVNIADVHLEMVRQSYSLYLRFNESSSGFVGLHDILLDHYYKAASIQVSETEDHTALLAGST